MSNKIQVLPQALCNQIAAGEVLERAASAVKELVENSLDAGATSIEIELDEGGRKRLSVCDNGCGMSYEDARLSILRHATSKLRTTEDLAAISTMGFRGEALASMAAVSKMTITTQRREDPMGTFIRVEGAEMLECRETAAPVGTQIVLEDLFFNTPARLKFLKTVSTELRRTYDVIEQFALACHEVRWKLIFDGRVKCDFPAHKSLSDRAYAVFGSVLHQHLYPIEPTTLGDVTVEGLFCSPNYSQSSTGRIYTYVNRRIVKDRTINSAITKAYQEFLHGKQPCVVLFLTIPLHMVDVNVHPTKHEIRFQAPDNVFRAVQRALRQSLEKTPWIKHQGTQTTEEPYIPTAQDLDALPESAYRSPEENIHRLYGLPSLSLERMRASQNHENMRQTTVEINHGVHDVFGDGGAAFDELALPTIPTNLSHETVTQDQDFVLRPQPPLPMSLEGQVQTLPLGQNETFGYFSSLRYIGQHDLTYLICADGDAIVIIDQHAAHERINFERLKGIAEDVLPAASQGLLFPILLPLDMRLSDILVEYLGFFEKLGFQIDDLGHQSFAIRAIPECLNGYDYAALIRDALIDLGDSGRASQFEEIRDHILATMACHSSIRAGQKLSIDEVKELFRLMDATGFRSNCPHGRPVHFTLSHSELEKRFLRS